MPFSMTKVNPCNQATVPMFIDENQMHEHVRTASKATIPMFLDEIQMQEHVRNAS